MCPTPRPLAQLDGQIELTAWRDLQYLESITDALKRNFDVFERKFRLQEMKIVEELPRVAHKEGDRIIETVLDGPHNPVSLFWAYYVYRRLTHCT